MSTTLDLLLAQLEPLLADDPDNNYSLTRFLGAIGEMYETVKELADDDDSGNTGWSILLDLDRCPSYALPWLAQFVGATVDPSFSDADQRQQILDVAAWKRGSVAALEGAALPYLTGDQTVIFVERDATASPSDPAYGLTVYTRTSETTDSAAVLAALNAVKPAGIILNYATIAGQTYEDIYLNDATYDTVYTTYATYQAVLTG